MPRGRAAALTLLFWASIAPAAAQGRADLYGRVLDITEGGVAQASVTVVNQDTGFRRITESQPDGTYAVASLQPGIYKVTVRKDGFRTVIRFGVRLTAAATTRADFILPVGSVEESITVEGAGPQIERQDASTGVEFRQDDLTRLPLNGGGVLALLDLVPGTNVTPATRGEAGQFTTNGQRPNTNYFTVDGISANTGVTAGGLPAQSTGGSMPALSAFGSLDAMISLDAAQEFRIQTSTGVAEFGRLPGANIALNSRSGSNQFHGSAAYRLRNELFDANDWFANQAGFGRAPLRLQDFSQAAGGPLRRNRSFFFLSYQRTTLRQPYLWRQAVPTLGARQSAVDWAQPALNLFPAPNQGPVASGLAQWTGRNDHPAGLHAGGVRVDQALTARLTLFVRYNDAPSTNQFGSVDVNRLDLRARSVTLGLSARPSANAALDLRINGSEGATHSYWAPPGQTAGPGCTLEPLTTEFLGAPQTCDYLVRFWLGGAGQLVSGREGDRTQRQFQAVQTGTLHHGRHAIGFGADYRQIEAVRRDPTGALGVIADDLASLTHNGVWISQRTDAQAASAHMKELSLWVQDTWQATPRLTLAAGLRWEFSPAPLPSGEPYFFNPASGTVQQFHRPLWPLDFGNFAPRLGAAYRLTKNGRTVLRAGGGLYYDSALSIATDILNGGPLSVSQFHSGRFGLFSALLSFGFMPDLRLPEVTQWNVTLEQAVGEHGVVSLGYVGAAGRNLLRREVGGEGNTVTSLVALTTNRGESDYHGLQFQFRRRFARGLQSLVSYTWSHSLDNDSSDAAFVWAGAGAGAATDRGSSDFDLRHSLAASLGYDFPTWASGWGIDATFRARSGFPIAVLESEEYQGIGLANAFRPNLAPGEPIWLANAGAPGGRILNASAFLNAQPGIQGNLGRNAIAGFGMAQLDVALRREFRLAEQRSIQLRVTAFNALNHPNFADPVNYLNSLLFGQSVAMLNVMLGTGSPGSGLAPLMQMGGARSWQAEVRVQF